MVEFLCCISRRICGDSARGDVSLAPPQTKTPRSEQIQQTVDAIIRINGRIHCLAYLHTKATVGVMETGKWCQSSQGTHSSVACECFAPPDNLLQLLQTLDT